MRRIVLAAALIAGGLAACQPERPKPPIIVILIDTLRADYLGVYGFEGNISPHIDRFAKRAVVFRNCFSQAPWTKPSIASLFTSLQVPVHRVESHEGKFGDRALENTTDTLAEDAVTLAEVLKDGGYATAAFVVNPWLRVRHGFGQGFDVFDTDSKGNTMRADRVLEAAEEWIKATPVDRPYFVYLHLMDVHGPYNAPSEDYEAVRDSPTLGDPQEISSGEQQGIPGYLRRAPWVRKDGNNVRDWRGRYAAGVHALDGRLGKFFKRLRALGVLDRAAVIITADHGEQLFEHGNWDHGSSLFDEELHVPLIVRRPGGHGGGRQVEDLVSLVDVMPTVVALAGLPAVAGVQGRDLGELPHSDQSERQSVPSFASAVKWKPTLHSARTERYKLIKNLGSGHRELYDVRDDPGEKHNVAGDSTALAEMETVLQAQFERNAARGQLVPGRGRLSETVRERLRALGYDEEKPTPSPRTRARERRRAPRDEQRATRNGSRATPTTK